MTELEKRTWFYVNSPTTYEIHCDRCGGSNLEWSEYAGMVWCYDCQIDTKGDGGIFAGPIAIKLMEMLGISLDRIDLATGQRLTPKTDEHGHIEYVSREQNGAEKW